MDEVFLFSVRFCDHIIHIHFYFLVNHIMEQGYHCTLICCPCVFQTERHYLVTKSPPRCCECCLLHVFWCHLDLIVTGEAIHEREHFALCGTVHQCINVRQRKIILWTCSIQISIVNTHSDFPILLRYWHNISDPWWITHYL